MVRTIDNQNTIVRTIYYFLLNATNKALLYKEMYRLCHLRQPNNILRIVQRNFHENISEE